MKRTGEKEAPEGVVLELQARIYALKDEYLELVEIATKARFALNTAATRVLSAERRMREIAEFLNKECGTAGTNNDYLVAVGLKQ